MISRSTLWLVLRILMRTTIRFFSLLGLGLLVAGSACSSSGTNDDAGAGDSSVTDAAKKDVSVKETGPVDSAVTCNAQASYSGSLSNETATYQPTPADAGADAGPEDAYQFQGAYNTNADTLDIEIYDGYGVFANGVQPGTYNLTGDELNYDSCGLCVLLIADETSQGGDPYMATGGSITITSISPTGTFAGSGTSLAFTHVTIDENTLESTPVGDGCNTAIASVSFSATVTQGQ